MSTWANAALGDLLADATPGFACGEDVEDGVFQFRMNNITAEGRLDLGKRRRVPKDYRNIDRFLLQPGDVLFNATNSPDLVGKSAFFPGLEEPATLSNHFLRLRSRNGELDGRYLARWLNLQFVRGQFKGMCRQWVNQATVGRDALMSLRIPLPSLSEQRRIAGILDKADVLRVTRRQAIAQLNTLTECIFLDMFGDPATNANCFLSARLDALIREGDSINYGVVQPGEDCEGGVPLIRVGDLQDGKVEHSSLKRISPSIESAYKRSRLRGDEILISCVGSTGMIALADESIRGFNVARAVARVPLAESIDRTYVASYLQTASVQRYFQNELRTVSQPTLNIKQISETVVLVPPLNQQREFARRVDAVNRLRDRERESLVGLDSMFASIQAHAFRGEL